MTEEELYEMRKESIRRLRELTRKYSERGFHFQCGTGRIKNQPVLDGVDPQSSKE